MVEMCRAGDFGLAKIRTATMTQYGQGQGVAGTLRWMPPEFLKVGGKKSASTASDVYSLAVVLWEILTGLMPFDGDDDDTVREAIKQGELLDIPGRLPAKVSQLLQQCWRPNPKDRPTCEQVIYALKVVEAELRNGEASIAPVAASRPAVAAIKTPAQPPAPAAVRAPVAVSVAARGAGVGAVMAPAASVSLMNQPKAVGIVSEKNANEHQADAHRKAAPLFQGHPNSFLKLSAVQQLAVSKLKIIGRCAPEHFQQIAETIKQSSSMTTVDLSWKNIGDDGARALADALKVSCSMTSVNLIGNKIGADGARALADALKVSRSMTSVDLGGNKIGDDGARALADALKVSSSMTSVDLLQNDIGADGARALADALKVSRSMTTVNLSWNNIGDDGARALAELRKHRPALQISV